MSQRLDVEAFARGHFLLAFQRLRHEPAGSFGVVDVGQRHPPIRHRTVGVDLRHLPERPLRLVVPEAMNLPEALVEPLLHLGLQLRGLRGDLQPHHAATRHLSSGLPRPLIKRLTMHGMTRCGFGIRRFGVFRQYRSCLEQAERQPEENHSKEVSHWSQGARHRNSHSGRGGRIAPPPCGFDAPKPPGPTRPSNGSPFFDQYTSSGDPSRQAASRFESRPCEPEATAPGAQPIRRRSRHSAPSSVSHRPLAGSARLVPSPGTLVAAYRSGGRCHPIAGRDMT